MKWHVKVVLLSLSGLFLSMQTKEIIHHVNETLILRKVPSYLKDAVQEHITFYARENVNSDKLIPRKGILIRRSAAPATVLICHGFTLDKFDVNFLHLIFTDYNTMTFDFRAHGELAEGQYCTFGRDESYDVLAAVDFIKSHPDLKEKPVFVYAFSMGAVASIIAQAQERGLFKGMILDCPFDSSDKLLDRGIDQLKISLFGYRVPFPGGSLLKSYAYNPYMQYVIKLILKAFTSMDSTQVNTAICPVYPDEAMRHITVPCFIIGCINDDKAPEEAVRSVYNNAAGFKRLWITEGRRHFDPIFYKTHEYIYRVNQFFKRCLQGTLNTHKPHKIIRHISQEKKEETSNENKTNQA